MGVLVWVSATSGGGEVARWKDAPAHTQPAHINVEAALAHVALMPASKDAQAAHSCAVTLVRHAYHVYVCSAGGAGEVARLEDALAHSQAACTKAEAALAHMTASKDTELQTAWQEATLAKQQLRQAQHEVAGLKTANASLVQEQQV